MDGERALRNLARLTLTKVRTDVVERAGHMDSALLRSLDAIQLASALDLGDDLESVVTYDERLADACEAHGVPTVAPS